MVKNTNPTSTVPYMVRPFYIRIQYNQTKNYTKNHHFKESYNMGFPFHKNKLIQTLMGNGPT